MEVHEEYFYFSFVFFLSCISLLLFYSTDLLAFASISFFVPSFGSIPFLFLSYFYFSLPSYRLYFFPCSSLVLSFYPFSPPSLLSFLDDTERHSRISSVSAAPGSLPPEVGINPEGADDTSVSSLMAGDGGRMWSLLSLLLFSLLRPCDADGAEGVFVKVGHLLIMCLWITSVKLWKTYLKKNTVCFLSRRRVLTHAPMTVSSGDNNNNKTKLILFICSILREIETQLNKEKTHLLSAHVLTKLSSSHSVSPKVD